MAARRDRSRGRQRRGRGFRFRSVAAPQPTPATGPELWVDASNWTKDLTDQGCADLKAAGVVGCIIQAITGVDGNSYTRQQLDACQRNGLRIAGYIWCNRNGTATSGRLRLFDGFTLEQLWLDVEEAGLQRSDVDRDFALCDAYMGKPTGLYSGRWWFVQQGWTNVTWWGDRPLWSSSYDGVPDASENFIPYGGWSRCAIKQYRGTSAIGHVSQIDLDVTNA